MHVCRVIYRQKQWVKIKPIRSYFDVSEIDIRLFLGDFQETEDFGEAVITLCCFTTRYVEMGSTQ